MESHGNTNGWCDRCDYLTVACLHVSCTDCTFVTSTVAFVTTCILAPCGLQGCKNCKNRPAPFPGWMSYKATKPGLVLFFVVVLHGISVLPRPYVIHFLLLWHDIAYLC